MVGPSKEKKEINKMSQALNTVNQRLRAMEKKGKSAAKNFVASEKGAVQSNRKPRRYLSPSEQSSKKAFTQKAKFRLFGNMAPIERGVKGSDPSANPDNVIAQQRYLESAVESHIANGAPIANVEASDYLKSLVDPEESGEGVGIPDMYPNKTLRYQSIREVPIDQEYFTDSGFSCIIVCPDVVDHYMLPTKPKLGGVYTLVSAGVVGEFLGALRDRLWQEPAKSSQANFMSYRSHFNSQSEGQDAACSLAASDGKTNDWPYAIIGDLPPTFSGAVLGCPIMSFGGNPTAVQSVAFRVGPGRLNSFPISQSETVSGMWDADAPVDSSDSMVFPSRISAGGEVAVGVPMIVTGNTTNLAPHTDQPVGRLRGIATLPTNWGANVANSGTAYSVSSPVLCVMLMCRAINAQTGQDVYICRWKCVSAPPSLTKDGTIQCAFDVKFDPAGGDFDVPDGVIFETAGGSVVNTTATFCVYSIEAAVYATASTYTSDNAYNFNQGFVPIELHDFTAGICYYYNGHDVGPRQTSAYPFQVGCFMSAYSIDDLSAFGTGEWVSYRPVSMSAWLKYAGGTLNNVGILHGSEIQDRRPPADRDHNYLTTTSLVTLDHCYRGESQFGMYGVYKPQVECDLEFREPCYKFNFDAPYLVYTIQSAGTANPESSVYSLRIISNWEVVTYAAEFRSSLQESIINPSELKSVLQLLQHFPCVMENDTHQSAISSFFSGLWNGVKKAVGFVANNAGTIGKVAEMLV